MGENEIEYIEEVEKEVERIRKAALERVRITHPEIEYAVDRRSIDDYYTMTWDYPGKWYCQGFTLPKGFKTKDELINAIARDTISYFDDKNNRGSGFFKRIKKAAGRIFN